MMNGFLLNPAVAGSEGYTAINLTAREQWLGLTGAPRTHAISFQTRILKNSFISRGSSVRRRQRMGSRSGRIGLGAYVFNDRNGLLDRTGLQLTYAYHLHVGEGQFSLGLTLTGYQFSIDEERLILYDEGDELINNTDKSVLIPDANFGVYYSDPNMFAGLSVAQLFESSKILREKGYESQKMERHYYLMAGYDFPISYTLTIEPSFLLKTSEIWSPQLDVNAKLIFQDEYWGGISYRTGGALVFMGGVRVDKFFFGYAFDYTLSSIMRHTYGSHEIMVAIKFGDNARRYRWLNRF